jgi:hypothetical protein
MGGRFWVVVWARASFPSCERRWLTHLGGIVGVVFELRTRWMLNVGT